MKCRHGVCRMSEHCGEGKCGWFEPDKTRISSVQSTALLDLPFQDLVYWYSDADLPTGLSIRSVIEAFGKSNRH